MDEYLQQFSGDEDEMNSEQWAAYWLNRTLPDKLTIYSDYVNAQMALKLCITWFAENVPNWQQLPEVKIAIGEAAHIPGNRGRLSP